MTTTPTDRAQSLTQQVARLIRMEMASQDGLRQSQLARRMGRTEQWLSVRLRGVQAIDLNDLQEIADGLGVPVVQLLPSSAQHGGTITRYPPVTERPVPMPVVTADRPADTRPPGRRVAAQPERTAKVATRPVGHAGSTPRRVARLATQR